MKTKAKLILTVWYDHMTEAEAERRLRNLVQYACDEGQLTGEGPGLVDTYTVDVHTERAT